MVINVTADAGSSKTTWLLADARGEELRRVRTRGLNAVLISYADVSAVASEVMSEFGTSDYVAEVNYYGAGCATRSICESMAEMLSRAFGTDAVSVASDLVGAARSLLGDNRGIACILGTGSNSCLYEAGQVLQNVRSLGYVLDDRGSGNAIGRRLLADAFKGIMPRALANDLKSLYEVDIDTVLENTYRRPAPNRFLASFAPFAAEHADDPYISQLLRDEFGAFLDRNVMQYAEAHELPVCFTGGIAYNFRRQLAEACEERGLTVGKITEQPMDDLFSYHLNRLGKTARLGTND